MNKLLQQIDNLKKNNYKERLILYRKIEREYPDKITKKLHKEIFNTAYNASFAALYAYKNPFDGFVNGQYALFHLTFLDDIPVDKYYKLYKFLSDILLGLGKYERALNYNYTAEKYAEDDEPYKYKILLVRGKIFTKQKKWKEAETLYKKCFNFFKNIKDTDSAYHPILYFYLFDKQEFEKAKKYINQLDKDEEDYFLYTGYYYAMQERYKESFDFFQEYIKKCESTQFKIEFLFYYAKSLIFCDHKDWKNAVKDFIRQLTDQNLNYRGIMQYDIFANNNIEYFENLFSDILEKDIKIAYEILILIKNYYNIVDLEFPEFQYRLKDDEHIFYDYKFEKFQLEYITIDNIQNKLSKSQVVYDYYYNATDFYIFVVSKQNISLIHKKLKESIVDNKIDSINQLVNVELEHKIILKGTDNLNISVLLKEFKNLLIPVLNGNKEIIFIPYKKLNQFNFYNISNDFPIQKNIYVVNNSYLIHHQKKSIKKNILFVRNPNLNFTEDEQKFIDLLYNVKIVLSMKDVLKYYQDFSIIHFSAHFYFNEKNFYKSYIDLGQDKLYYHQIEQLKSDNKKIFLALCESGQKSRLRIEENLDLARIFLKNQASEILVSLYEITDGLSFNFFKEFYTKFQNQNTFAKTLSKVLERHPDFLTINPFFVRA